MSQHQLNSEDAHGAPAAPRIEAHRPRRQALLIPGMHRSGTSALTGVLSHLGALPPKTLLSSAKDNPRGFWESVEVVRFNDEILASAGGRWDDWEPFNPGWLESAAAEPFLERVPALLEKEYGDARLLLLKDPRICRLMPFWIEAFRRQDIAVSVAIPLRHPGEVAASLEARNKFGRNRALLIWLRHVLEAEAATRSLPRTLLHFEDLLDDWRSQCQRISTELDLQWPRWSGEVEAAIDQYLSGELRKQRALADQVTPSAELQAWIDTARQALDALVTTQGRDPAARATLDDLRQAFDSRSAIFASVVTEYAHVTAQATRQLETAREALEDATTQLALQDRAIAHARHQKVQMDRWVARIEAGALQAAESSKTQVLKTRELQRQLGERFKEIERLTRLLMQSEGRIAERDSQIGQLRAQIDAIFSSRGWRLMGPARRLARMAKRVRGGAHSDAQLVRDSGWFDAAWYLKRYPDVAAAGLEPVAHYLDFGAVEGRDPGPRFDTRYYLQAYPDVAASGLNPLVHFLRHGQSEDRKARASTA